MDDDAGAARKPTCRRQAAAWFAALRDRICAAFEAIEDAYAGPDATTLAAGRFVRKPWERRAAAAARSR